MIPLIINIYRIVFLRKFFYRFNKLLFNLSLRGLGILNYENDRLSGEKWFLNRYIKDKTDLLILDVGANVGNYSNKIKLLAPDATIYAFEPHPKTFKILHSAALKNGYIALNLGVSDFKGTCRLYDYCAENSGSEHASMHEDVIKKIHKGEAASWDIKASTIDHFLDEKGISKVNLLKVDTEGNELKVLYGAKKSISSELIDIIHFEFNEMNIISRAFFRDFFDLLPQYNLYRLLPDGLLPLDHYVPLHCEIFAYQNIIAIRKKFCGIIYV